MHATLITNPNWALVFAYIRGGHFFPLLLKIFSVVLHILLVLHVHLILLIYWLSTLKMGLCAWKMEKHVAPKTFIVGRVF